MHPSFQVFGVTIHFYSIFFLLGLVAGCLIFVYSNPKLKKYREQLLDCYLYILIGILLGSKLMYVLLHVQDYVEDFSRIWTDFRRGFAFYGGFIGAIIAVLLFFRKKKLPIWAFVDSAAPAIPLGHAIGRIGCIFAGCCYGTPTDLPWGIIYPTSCPIAPSGVSLHPYPVYELLLNLVLFGTLMLLRNKVKVGGRLMSMYLIGYSLIRFGLDYVRGDFKEYYFGLSDSQWISIIMFVIGVVAFILLKLKKEQTIE